MAASLHWSEFHTSVPNMEKKLLLHRMINQQSLTHVQFNYILINSPSKTLLVVFFNVRFQPNLELQFPDANSK